MSVHFVRTLLDHVISFVLLRPNIPSTTTWQRENPPEPKPVVTIKQEKPPKTVQQAALVYPVLPPRPYRHGDGMQAYHAAHPLPEQGQRTQPVTTRLKQLPIQIQQKVVAQLPPGGIARLNMEDIPTVKQLSPDMLPPHVTGHISVASGMLPDNMEIMARARAHALGHSTHLEPRPPQQVSQSLWVEQQPVSAFLGDPNSHTSPLHGTWNAEEHTPEWLNEEPTLPTRPSGYLLAKQQHSIHYWDEIERMAGRKEEDIPTLNLPSVTENIAKKYRERE